MRFNAARRAQLGWPSDLADPNAAPPTAPIAGVDLRYLEIDGALFTHVLHLALLHLAHSFASAGERVHAFVCATHLTHITRYLRYRDVDEADPGIRSRH